VPQRTNAGDDLGQVLAHRRLGADQPHADPARKARELLGQPVGRQVGQPAHRYVAILARHVAAVREVDEHRAERRVFRGKADARAAVRRAQHRKVAERRGMFLLNSGTLLHCGPPGPSRTIGLDPRKVTRPSPERD